MVGCDCVGCGCAGCARGCAGWGCAGVGCACSAGAAGAAAEFLVLWRLPVEPSAFAFFFDRLAGEDLELGAGGWETAGRTAAGVVIFTVGAIGLLGGSKTFGLARGRITLAAVLGIATTTADAALTVGTLPLEFARGSTVTFGAEGCML